MLPVMISRFKNSKARLQRAYLHHKAILAEWVSILGSDSASPAARPDKDPGWYILSACLTPESMDLIASSQMSLEVGELVYQLRSALDSLIWDAITYSEGAEPPPNANRLEFPIRQVEDFRKCAFHKFRLPKTIVDWLETIQPGSPVKVEGHQDFGLETTLEDIHNLARFDRHRRLRIVGAIPSTSSVEVETKPPGGAIVEHEWLHCDIFNGKYDFVRIKVECAGGLLPYNLRLKTSLKFDLSVEDVHFYDDADLGVQLGRFIKAVEYVIQRFEVEFS